MFQFKNGERIPLDWKKKSLAKNLLFKNKKKSVVGRGEKEVLFLVLAVRSLAMLVEQYSFPCGRSRGVLSETASLAMSPAAQTNLVLLRIWGLSTSLCTPWCFTWPIWKWLCNTVPPQWQRGDSGYWGSPPQALGLDTPVLHHLGVFSTKHKAFTWGDLLHLSAWWPTRDTDSVHALLPWEAASGQCRHQGSGSWAALDNYCSLEARRNLNWI